MTEYIVIFEWTGNNYSAYVPDLPGCGAVAETENEVMDLIHEAIEFHLECLRDDGEQIPSPRSNVSFVEVLAA